MAKVQRDTSMKLGAALVAADKSGELAFTPDEAQTALAGSGVKMEEYFFIFNIMSPDASGKLDIGQALAFLSFPPTGPEKESTYAAELLSKMVDRNGDGKITRGELKAGLAVHGIHATPEELAQLWKDMGGSKGTVDKDDFVKYWAKKL